MRARPNQNSRFARRFKPRARRKPLEAVDYFTAFTHVSPDSGRIRVSRMRAKRNFLLPRPRSTTPALKMTGGNLC